MPARALAGAQCQVIEAGNAFVIRGGWHSGDLLLDPAPAARTLQDVIEGAALRFLDQRPGDDMLGQTPDSLVVSAWGIVLEGGGYQRPHIHPTAWVSGVYYVDVPPARAGASPNAGWLEFGCPDPDLGCKVVPSLRRVRPVPGSIVLFPSYLYHRTLPFDGPGQRISIAFDLARD